ncbi:MAG: hypothetical protein COA82_00440 [Alkaliphilus sp.]|nr:MAG: hypothetical protein COA82_00440 [Alkaliphilus sp.]
MTIGLIVLIGITALVFMGVAERALDRIRLSDKTAVLVLIAIIVTTLFIPNLYITKNVAINIGGFVIPMLLVVYLFSKAGTTKERIRCIVASLITGVVIYITQRFVLPVEPEQLNVDPNFVYSILAGLIAYLAGRSRRTAFIAGITGVVLSDIIQLVENIIYEIPSPTLFGGAGGADTTFMAGIIALLLVEVIGEIRERLQGGTEKKDLFVKEGQFIKKNENIKKRK